jgi:hypothetical protein
VFESESKTNFILSLFYIFAHRTALLRAGFRVLTEDLHDSQVNNHS